MELFPLFLKITGRRCLVVGAGRVAEEKIASLLRGGAAVQVAAPRATDRVRKWAREGKIRWKSRSYRSSDLAGVFLVVAATSSADLHQRIFREASARAILCNIADDPPHCDFYYGSVVRRGALQIAISTAGLSPALAQRLRKELSLQFGAEYEAWLRYLGAEREKLMQQKIPLQRRKLLLHRLASRAAFEKFMRKERQAERRMERQPHHCKRRLRSGKKRVSTDPVTERRTVLLEESPSMPCAATFTV